MANELIALDQIERMAKYAVESQLFGVKTVSQAVSLMMLCQAKGMHPMEAVEEFYVVNGRATMRTERMLAKFQAAGGRVEWHQLTDDVADASFSHPQAGTVRIVWSLEMAKKAGLAGKDVWKSYSRAMLRSRCVSEGIRSTFPGVQGGAYAPEEAQDIPAPVGEKDITPPAEPPKSGVAALAARLPKPAAPVAEAQPAEDATLLALQGEAMNGIKALEAAWKALSLADRATYRPHLDSLKAAATEADQAGALPLEAA